MNMTSFPPGIGSGVRVLIVGSMPGQMSLHYGQYYAHPQNIFWDVMEAVWGIEHTLPYATRVQQLKDNGVGLWDVLSHCEREGSLDSTIVKSSERANDLAALFPAYPTLAAVAFNGQKAHQAFKRHVLPTLSEEVQKTVTFLVVPSSSPANTSMRRAAKVEAWRVLRQYTPAYS